MARMIETMRRLHPRGAAARGICVDAEGATFGPACILVRPTAQGYRCVAPEEARAIQAIALPISSDPDWLFDQCRRIRDALQKGEIALAQIYGLQIPIGELDDAQLERLASTAALIKANFNPDQPRIPRDEPEAGRWVYVPGYAKPRTGDGRSDAADRDDNGSPGDEDAGGEGSGAAPDRENESDDAAGGNGRGRAPGGQAGNIPEVIPAAYQGYYHDEVVELLRRATIAGGGTAITLVPLTAI